MKLDLTDPDEVLAFCISAFFIVLLVAVALCGVAGIVALAKYVYLWEPKL